jgi:hypothetical protein
VASVTVSPESAQVEAGRTVQFTATARNSAGATLDGVTFVWEVSDPALASVDANGLVTGTAAGVVEVRATASETTGSSQLTVVAVGAPLSINAISPAEMVEGQAATITGTGFKSNPALNIVRVGGITAQITSGTTTELRILVPVDCKQNGPVGVQVIAGTGTSPLFSHPLRSATAPMDVEPQTMTTLHSPQNLCLRFEASADEQYLVGVQSTSEDVSAQVGLRVRGLASSPAGDLVTAHVPSDRAVGGIRAIQQDRFTNLLDRHRAAEARLRDREQDLLRTGRIPVAAVRSLRARGPLFPAAVPQVGDPMDVRVPDILIGNPCTDFITTPTIVRYVGQRAIFVEDAGNPSPFTDADLEELSRMFDEEIHGTLVEYFGEPSDLDGNGRVVIVITKKLNEWLDDLGLLGFVTVANLAPRTTCPASNEGEFFFSLAPDPSGAFGPAMPVGDVRSLEQILIAHETTHIIQFSRRLAVPGMKGLMPSWQAEGQATLAEEVVGFHVRGRTTGQNYGPAVFFGEVDPAWHQGLNDLLVYFGFDGPTQRINGAPERCSFLGGPAEGNTGPCGARMEYGVAWSFLRWLSDQYGPLRPGGEQDLHRDIIENTEVSFATIEQVVGASRQDLLARWAASLYLDDRSPEVNPALAWSSWNLQAIAEAVVAPARLTPRSRTFSTSFDDAIFVRAGSTAYYLVSGVPGTSTAIRVRTIVGGAAPPEIQVWVVRTR